MNPAGTDRRVGARRHDDIAGNAAIARLEERMNGIERRFDERLDDISQTLHEIRDNQKEHDTHDARVMGAVDLGKWLIGGGSATAIGLSLMALICKWINMQSGTTP